MKLGWPRVLSIAVVLMLGLGFVASSCSKKKSGGQVMNPGGTLELSSDNLGMGGTYDHAFANAGTYAYHCSFHGTMHGSVTVVAGSPTSANVTIASFAFGPASVSVAPGGTVRWINNDAATHTVTSDP